MHVCAKLMIGWNTFSSAASDGCVSPSATSQSPATLGAGSVLSRSVMLTSEEAPLSTPPIADGSAARYSGPFRLPCEWPMNMSFVESKAIAVPVVEMLAGTVR